VLVDARPRQRDDRRRTLLVGAGYVASVGAYIGISFWTKRLLTWTNGPLYFLFTLELLPLGVRKLKAAVRR
jgi:hypothetical protein